MTDLSLEWLLGAALLGALTLYMLFAGADYGAGLWSFLFLKGPEAQRQRALVDQAIGPIWEANHVWLIIALTILFTAFPASFATIGTVLHIPLSLMLIGIVLRGTSFAVRTHDVSSRSDGVSSTPVVWRYIFAGSSLVTPGLLGISLGAIASGNLVRDRMSGSFTDVFVTPWLAAFPITVGILATAIAAHLAAVYLLVECRQPDLKTVFRRRALASWSVVVVAAAAALLQSRQAAPLLYQHLLHTWIGAGMIVLTSLLTAGTLVSLLRWHDALARLSSAGAAVSLLWGWAFAQFPFLIPPVLSLYDSAPTGTLRVMAISLILGSVLLFPLIFYLYRLFKGHFL